MFNYLLTLSFLISSIFISYGQNPIVEEIEKIVKYDTDINLAPLQNLTIGIIDQDTSFVIHLGVPIDITKNTFEIGSVSKTMTASLFSILSEKNILSYQHKVNQYLPQAYQNPRLESLTLLDLLEHTSGLPKKPINIGKGESNIKNPYSHYSKQDLLMFYRDYIPINNNAYAYAHTNYALLEIIIENITKKSFEVIIQEHLFDPFQLNHSFVHLSELNQNLIVQGFDRSNTTCSPRMYPSFAASEGIKTTLDDLIKYVGMHLNSEQFDQNIKKRHLSNFNKYIFGGRGWHILTEESKEDIISMSGKSAGHHCMIAFLKQTRTGVVILSNHAEGSKDLGYLILRMINDNWDRIN